MARRTTSAHDQLNQGIRLAGTLSGYRLKSPRRTPIFETQRERLSAVDLHHFARQREVRSVLFDLRSRDFKRVIHFEHHANFVQELLGTKEDLPSIGITFQHQIHNWFPASWRNQFQL